jgi:type I restriction enzyme S subunit
MTALLIDNLPLLAGAPNGIKKLRELILELAVRGKLLEQNADDEAASELLKQIAEEKKQLVAKGKPREQVSLQQINEAEAPFKAAPGWLWIKLGDISLIERGGSPRPIKDFLTEDADGLNWIKIGDTDKGGKYITSAGEKIRREGLVKTRMVYPGDFLLTNSMSFGRPYITQIEGCIHDGWLRISPPTSLVKDYLYLLLSSPYVRSFFVQAAAGAVVLNLNADKVRELPIPLPPLAEQHRIVAKVEELMAVCDRLETRQADAESAHTQLVQALLDSLTQVCDATNFAANWQRLAEHFHTLFTTEPSIDALKQSLLQLAVMGKLVQQDPNDEPASEFVKRIQAEKQSYLAISKARKQKDLASNLQPEPPFDVPACWEWQTIDDVLHVTGGVTLGRKLGDRKLLSKPYLRVANVQRGRLEMEQIKEIEVPEDEVEKYLLRNGDLLITEGGDWDKVGRTAIWRDELPECLHQNHVFRARAVVTDWEPRWAEMYLNSASAREYFAGSAKQTTNLASINMTQLRACAFPLPPLGEQKRIIAKVDQLMAFCEQLKTRLTQACQLNEQLASTLVERSLAEDAQQGPIATDRQVASVRTAAK